MGLCVEICMRLLVSTEAKAAGFPWSWNYRQFVSHPDMSLGPLQGQCTLSPTELSLQPGFWNL